MRSIAIGLFAALFVAALAPVAAHAADKPAKASDVTADPKKHQQGMTDVPPLIQQTGIDCTPSDAFFLGQSKGKDSTGKDVNSKYYEVACQQGLGYILVVADNAPAAAYDCFAMNANRPKAGEADKGQIFCRLAPNTQPLQGLQPIVTKAGLANCTLADAKYKGSSATDKVDEYEIACASGQAYMMQVPRTNSDKKLMALDCLTMEPGKCDLFTKEKYVAALQAMAGPSGRSCQVNDGRYMGTAANNHNSFFEVGCSNQPVGFVVQVDANNKFVAAIECAKATTIAAGCTLTSAAAAETEQSATYSKLAKSINYPCDVKAYHGFGLEQSSGREVVELACNDHADGAIALLPVDANQKGEYFNCARAPNRGLKCSLTSDQSAYAKLTAELTEAGKTCQVTGARGAGVDTKTGLDYVEVQCAAGPGMMLAYSPGPESVKSVMTCAQAASVGGCKLGK